MNQLLGTRRHLVPALGRPADLIDLDAPAYADPASVRRYVQACLTDLSIESAYRHQPRPYLEAVAEAVAAAAGSSFLVALITARSLALTPGLVDPADPAWRAGLPRLAEDALRADLDLRLGADADRARDLLLPLAYAQGTGLPWEDLWPCLARTLTGSPYTSTHLAGHAAGTPRLDALAVDPRFLLAAGPPQLLTALPATTTPPAHAAADAYRRAATRLHVSPACHHPAYLQLAARCARAPHLADAITASNLPLAWATGWASWRLQPAHTTLTGHTDWVNAVALGHVEGRTVIVSGSNDATVRVWDAATGTRGCEPVQLSSAGGQPVVAHWSRTLAHPRTRPDTTGPDKNGPGPAFPLVRGRFGWWWRVMDSNQRRTTPTVLQGRTRHGPDQPRCPSRSGHPHRSRTAPDNRGAPARQPERRASRTPHAPAVVDDWTPSSPGGLPRSSTSCDSTNAEPPSCGRPPGRRWRGCCGRSGCRGGRGRGPARGRRGSASCRVIASSVRARRPGRRRRGCCGRSGCRGGRGRGPVRGRRGSPRAG